jgi:hypothetical protein
MRATEGQTIRQADNAAGSRTGKNRRAVIASPATCQ